MFLKKNLLLKKVKEYKIDFTAFSAGMNTEIDDTLMPVKYAKKLYNFTVKDGALKSGLGFSRLKVPKTEDVFEKEEITVPEAPFNTKIKGFWHYKYYSHSLGRPRHRIFFHSDNNAIYFFKGTSQVASIFQLIMQEGENNFSGKINGVNYHLNGEDCLILFVPDQSRILVIDTADFGNVYENAPDLVTIALHNERLFAVKDGDRKTLMFSANLDPTNWNIELDEGGFIDLRDERGKINKIVSFNDYVYLFRDFGVSRISAYGNQEEFNVTQLFVASSKIYGASVTSCGDRIMFLAQDGLYIFDGYSTSKVQLNFEELIRNVPNDNACSAFFKNKYYLALRMDFADDKKIGCEEDAYVNNALIEYDLKTGDVNILRGIDILDMAAMQEGNLSKLIACFRGYEGKYFGQLDNSGTFFDKKLEASWTSPKTNFGFPNQIKIVKEVLIKSQQDCKIVITTEKESKTYNVYGKSTLQRVRTNVRGEEVEIAFVSKTALGADISAPQITIGVVQ